MTILGYVGFLSGYKIASLGKPALFMKLQSTEYKIPYNVCVLFAVLYSFINFIILLHEFPSPKDIVTFWLSNPAGAFLEAVGHGEVLMTGTITGYAYNFLFSAFFICWAIFFKHRKYLALLIWFLFIYSQLGQYVGRSVILHYLAIPLYLYFLYSQGKNKGKKLIIISSFLIFTLIFLAFMGAVRGDAVGFDEIRNNW